LPAHAVTEHQAEADNQNEAEYEKYIEFLIETGKRSAKLSRL
jgi:hypothetical protein